MQHRDRTFRFSVLLRLALAVVLATLPLLALPTALHASAQGAINLPYGFISEIVVEGMNLPTSFALAPDGRIFVAEKAGRVRVIKDGQLLETPFVDLSGEVNDSADRGLMGIAVHPKWPAAPYVYVAYVYDPPEASGKNPSGARVSRVLRLTASADNLDVEQPGSGVVLLGTNSTFAHIGNPDQGDAEPFSCIDEGGAPVREEFLALPITEDGRRSARQVIPWADRCTAWGCRTGFRCTERGCGAASRRAQATRTACEATWGRR